MAQKGLGRGLGALLGDFPQGNTEEKGPVRMIPLQKIEPNPEQPRKVLTRRNCRIWRSPLRKTDLFSR